MLSTEGCAWNQIFAHRQAADQYRFEAYLPDQVGCHGNGIRVVTCDWYADRIVWSMRVPSQLGIADCVEGADDFGAGQDLCGCNGRAALLGNRFDEVVAIAPGNRVADIED